MSGQENGTTERKIGLALSGGGARAMAFHLGCMRSLHRHGILDKVQVLSTVSGGSVIGAMWAYWDDSFESFDQRVQEALGKGQTWGLVKQTLGSMETLRILISLLTSGLLALVSAILRSVFFVVVFLLNLFGQQSVWLGKISSVLKAPFPRFASRTTAFIRHLDKALFKGAKLKDVKRKGLEVIINATEMRTQTAFRYGSRESGTWRFGRLSEEATVAKAVGASAAFPILLPCVDERQRFEKNGTVTTHRTILTDGGVYDNLGTSCLLPGRDEDISLAVTGVNYIIACVAGHGLPDGSSTPCFWPSRMTGTLNTMHRRIHSMTYDKLHRLKDSGAIEGFLMPYLGQIDEKLDNPPEDLVPREKVYGYPTDFSHMTEENLALLTRRGEQLTDTLIKAYYTTSPGSMPVDG